MSLRTKRIKFEPLFKELECILNILYLRRNEKVSSMRIYQICYDICSARNQSFVNMLFCSLAEYLEKLLAITRESLLKTDSELLTSYAREFESFERVSRHLNDHFGYFNDTLFPPVDNLAPDFHYSSAIGDVKITHPKYGRQKVIGLCHSVWKEVVLKVFALQKSNVLLSQLMATINRDRNGYLVDCKILKTVIQSLVEVDSQTQLNQETVVLHLYLKEFEGPFLEEVHRFYKVEAALAISELTIPKYLAKIEGRIKQESRRNELILHPSSLPKALHAIQEEFLINHCEKIYPSLIKLIESESYDDCHRLYVLMSSFKDGTKPLLAVFEEFVLCKGRNALALFDKIESKDPREYVDLLLEVHHKYSRLCAEVLDNDAAFVTSLDKAFRKIINSTFGDPSNKLNSPELLAKYADILLKKSTRSAENSTLGLSASHASLLNKFSSQFAEGDIENQLSDLVILFKYIDDKDVFQKFYSRLLAKRLIYGTSISDEAEANMISKLKVACGLEYTSKLQRMITDASLNGDLNLLFKEHVKQKKAELSGDYQFLILTAGSWPLHNPNSTIIIPKELECDLKLFDAFYNMQYNGRKLTWMWHLFRGKYIVFLADLSGEVRINYLEKRYEISGTLPHCAILLKYNDHTTYTFGELKTVLMLTDTELSQNLKALLDCRLLLLDGTKPTPGPSKKNVYNFQPTSRLDLNMKFSR
ncbi:hypothetical protein DSO57_1011770 [Entomophthora muscae]|uniref:Uncharacterized protein n=1 Tax=Entomophthora muscae TaxID=34485 RepID=A0ACC2SVC3_9FUNG|nr:hypothetical protein DSO57_1011770 [Entomophthora muscae]